MELTVSYFTMFEILKTFFLLNYQQCYVWGNFNYIHFLRFFNLISQKVTYISYLLKHVLASNSFLVLPFYSWFAVLKCFYFISLVLCLEDMRKLYYKYRTHSGISNLYLFGYSECFMLTLSF